MKASDVSAVLITRGDVDLAPIIDTLPYDDVVIWNATERTNDASCYSRYLAAQEARFDVVYFQDDDLIFTAHDDLLAAYEPDRITGNMPSPWWERERYDELDCVLTGAGALVPQGLWDAAFHDYWAAWPWDDLFETYCDHISGILTQSTRVDFGYKILPCATDQGRINTTPGQASRKQTVINRALRLRDLVAA